MSSATAPGQQCLHMGGPRSERFAASAIIVPEPVVRLVNRLLVSAAAWSCGNRALHLGVVEGGFCRHPASGQYTLANPAPATANGGQGAHARSRASSG